MRQCGRNFLIFVTMLTLVDGSPLKTCPEKSTDEFTNSHVGLIISPILSNREVRNIEIYWTHDNLQSGDSIALYTQKPANHVASVYSFEPSVKNGIRKTGIEADFVPTSDLTFAKQCLKYHVAWLRNDTIRKINCLETRPTWMADRKNTLGTLKMKDIFLPGSHDSAAYSITKNAQSENLFTKYTITQDEDILAQLIYGVRYLDIRVGYYPLMNPVWWGNHGVLNVVPLQTVINDVKTFLKNTDEIVIFDVQEFPVGFGNNLKIHEKLVTYLEKEFVDYLLPKNAYGWSSTLGTIWSSGKRLIIGFDERTIVSRYSTVWPCVTHQWGDVRTISDLYAYLNRIENNARSTSSDNPRSAMAQLTPNTWDVILDRLGGLRKMADNVNINVTTWYNTAWHSSANIVAVDFIKSSGIIEAAIEWNDKRISSC